MAIYSYEYAPSGWNAATGAFTNFETTFTTPILFAPDRIPRGTVVSKATDGREVVDGWQEVVLRQIGEPFGYTLFANLTTYITAVHSSWAGEDAEISLRTDGLSGSYGYYNVIAHFPQIGRDYTHIDSTYIRDLALRFTVIAAYTPA